MDIVDGQVHSNMLGAETTLAIMDAIGIQSLLIDEYFDPGADGALLPKLARAIEAFGKHRVLWASDYTVSRDRQNWAESLFYIRHSPTLSTSDKEWTLGRTIRKLLKWPAPEHSPAPAAMHPHRLGGAAAATS